MRPSLLAVLASLPAPPLAAQGWTCHMTSVCGPRDCRDLDVTVPPEISPGGAARPGALFMLGKVPVGGNAPRVFVEPHDHAAAMPSLRQSIEFAVVRLAESSAALWETASPACQETH